MKKATLAMMAAALVLISACAAPAEQATEAPAAPTEGISLVDALDRQLEFEAAPERIVVAGRATPLLADAVYLFPEAIDRVVGLEARFQSRDDPFYPVIDPTYAEVTLLEMNASAEQILPVEPEVVVMKTFMAESLGDPLEQVNVPVVYLELETPEQFSRDIATLGQLFDNAARADEIISFYSDRQDRVAGLVDSATEAEAPTVLLAQYSAQDGEVSIEVPSASWLQTSLVELAGGAPVWVEAAPSGGWTVVGFEQIAAWDPEKIFIINYSEDPSVTVDNLAQDPNWASLKAVQAGELYGFPADFLSWDQPDTRWILGLQWLATKIKPELADEIDIMAEVEAFYSQLYGLDQSAIQAEILPRLKGDLP
jgi:iron complex transport system substrate-binding protein